MALQGQKYPALDPRQLQAWEYNRCGITDPGQRLSVEVWLTEAMFNDAGV